MRLAFFPTHPKPLRFAQASAGLVATGLGSDAGIVSFEDTLDKMKNWKIKR